MRKLLFLFLLITLLAMGESLFAQGPATASNPLGGNLTVQDAGTCLTNGSFLQQKLPVNASSTTVNLSGTFSGTVTVRVSNNGGGSWATLGTQTSAGTVSYSTNGYTDLCADVTTFTSGNFGVTISTGLNTGPQGPAGTGGGIASVSSLPGTCTLSSAPVQLTVAPFGIYTPLLVNGTCAYVLDSSVGFAVNPFSYGAKFDVRFDVGCTFTISTTVNCPHAAFTQADVGKIEFGTNAPSSVQQGVAGGTLVIPQGTITAVNSATQAVVSIIATAICTPTGSTLCTLAWGTQDDTTQINNAWAAAVTTDNGTCSLQMPAGAAFISGPVLSATTSPRCGGASGSGAALVDANSQGPVAYGQGMEATFLIPLPSYNFAACTFGNASSSCNGATANAYFHDFSIIGLGQGLNSTTHNNVLFDSFGLNNGSCPGGTTVANLGLADWATASTGTIGFQFANNGCNNPNIVNVNVQMFATLSCQVGSGTNTISAYGLICFGGSFNGGGILNVASAGLFNSFGGMYLGPLGVNGPLITMAANATMNSYGDTIWEEFGNANSFNVISMSNAGSQFNCFGSAIKASLANTAGTTTLLNISSGSATFRASGCQLNAAVGGGTDNKYINLAAGSTFVDLGGNTITQGVVANTVSGTYSGSSQLANTAVVAGNFVPSANFGTGAAVTAVTGNASNFTFTLTNGSAAVGASPTIAFTFPAAASASPARCSLWQVGGTQAITATTEFLAPSAQSATGVTFTYNSTPTINLTEFYQGGCAN